MKLYALKDVKSGLFGLPMGAQNDAHMCRTLVEALSGSRETVARFPEDFELYEVAEYSEENGSSKCGVRFVCGVQVVLTGNGGGSDA